MERLYRCREPFIAHRVTPLLAVVSVSAVFLYMILPRIDANLWLVPLSADTPSLSQLLPVGALALGVILTRSGQDSAS
jgi:hypothetical protein